MLKHSLDNLTDEVLAIFDCALEGIMIADAACRICYINQAYTRMTDLRPKQELGRPLKTAPPFGPLRTAITSGKPIYGCRYKPLGSNAELIVNASPIIANGTIKGGVSFSQDISAVLTLTKQLSQRSRQIETLTKKLESLCCAKYEFSHIIGDSAAFRNVIQMSQKAAAGLSTVLLTGESGTGKELFAHAIHTASPRSNKPFVKVNCAAIPENLLESELFGHVKGAFTGASTQKMGLFERADGGSLFLDEIGDMSPSLQCKLFRVLQDGEVKRIGNLHPQTVDVRVIAATNRNLPHMIIDGSFRKELYYRLNVMGIHIPPLRERLADIPLLVDFLLKQLNRKLGKNIKGLEPKALQKLIGYSWPGNVRELKNVLERALNLTDKPQIPAEVLFLPKENIIAVMNSDRAMPDYDFSAIDKGAIPSLADQENRLIQRALSLYGTSVKGKRQAASALGISLATLYNRLQVLEF